MDGLDDEATASAPNGTALASTHAVVLAWRALVFCSLSMLPAYCEPPEWLRGVPSTGGAAPPDTLPTSPATAPRVLALDPLRMDAFGAPSTPTYILRGAPRGPEKLVFLHGICGHPLGYAQAFQRSAAQFGALVAPQGDSECVPGSPLAKWSLDTVGLDTRIVAAFRELGVPEPLEGVLVIGYSQGASRAEALARKFPARYTRLVLIAGPTQVSPYGLSVRSALMMAGSLDRPDLMQASARAFTAAGRRSRYQSIPGARHGSLGVSPEQTMREALAWSY